MTSALGKSVTAQCFKTSLITCDKLQVYATTRVRVSVTIGLTGDGTIDKLLCQVLRKWCRAHVAILAGTGCSMHRHGCL